MKLDSLSVRGYKSIRRLENFELRNLNVLIGANGAGKSNFIGLFRMLAALAEGNLQGFVQKQGGPDVLLHRGRKCTPHISFGIYFGHQSYRFVLAPSVDNRLIFGAESIGPLDNTVTSLINDEIFDNVNWLCESVYRDQIRPIFQNWRVYHFHDTSDTAAVKGIHASNDNLRLKPDAANLAPYLAYLKSAFPDTYRRIVETIRLAAPFFGDFVTRDPLPPNIELEWTEQGDPDTPHRAHVLSDGTLRFICLTTLLLQPIFRLPDTVLIDEPELGLHPYAINLLADMLKEVAETKQVIVSTQSVELLNLFEPEDIVVVDRENDASTFRRLDTEALEDWLEDYSLGDLWKSNVFGGRPA